MDFGNIISNSFKYPFRDYKNLCIVFVLFALFLVAPVGAYLKSEAVVVLGIIINVVLLFILPGYWVSVTRQGCAESFEIPKIQLKSNFVNTLKLIVLDLVYLIIPILIMLAVVFLTGLSSYILHPITAFTEMQKMPLNYFDSLKLTLFIGILVYLVFSILYQIAFARLANFNSILKALNFVGALKDIKKIGVLKVIGWYFIMGILLCFVHFVLLFLIAIPYAGVIIYQCIALPILILIQYFSLGLLYSGISDEFDDDGDLETFEKELQRFKILGRWD